MREPPKAVIVIRRRRTPAADKIQGSNFVLSQDKESHFQECPEIRQSYNVLVSSRPLVNLRMAFCQCHLQIVRSVAGLERRYFKTNPNRLYTLL